MKVPKHYRLLKDLPNAKAGEIFTLCQRELANGSDETVLVGEWCEFCAEELKKFDILKPKSGWFEEVKDPEELGYWYYDTTSNWIDFINPEEWTKEDREKDKSIGNYFETKDEAEAAVKKLKAWKRLKDKGFRFNGRDWKAQCIDYKLDCRHFTETQMEEVDKDLDLLFEVENE